MRKGPQQTRAFTLVELMAVIAIIGLLLLLSIPALSSILRATNVNMAAQTVVGLLNRARLEALAHNRSVEFRFYKTPSRDNTTATYCALRYWTLDQNSQNPSPTSRMTYLPGGVAFSELKSDTFSTFTGMTTGTETLPIAGSVSYVSFHFRPNGSTDLSGASSWYWTLCNWTDHANSVTGLPNNFATIQMDPVTGRTVVYRP